MSQGSQTTRGDPNIEICTSVSKSYLEKQLALQREYEDEMIALESTIVRDETTGEIIN